MLPGAPPDTETLPPWVLCWLPALPAFAARGPEVAWVWAGEAEAPALVGRRLSEIRGWGWGGGVRGWSGDLGEYELGLGVDKNILDYPP